LVDGRARVELDPDLVAVVNIDDGDYHVFLTAEGETNGLYVSSRSPDAFEVREQHDGVSNSSFSYRLVTRNKHRQPRRLGRLEEPPELLEQVRRRRAPEVADKSPDRPTGTP
jgi:hypothetical protein